MIKSHQFECKMSIIGAIQINSHSNYLSRGVLFYTNLCGGNELKKLISHFRCSTLI